MFLINNKPFIDLENHIDFHSFTCLELEIIKGIVKSRYAIHDDSCGYDNQYDKSLKSIVTDSLNVKDKNNKYYLYYKDLGFDPYACRMFMRYTGEYSQMGQLLSLRTFDKNNIQYKSSAVECYDTRVADNFKPLMKWINDLEAFDSIGRVVFFFNAPKEPHAIHTDTYLGSSDEFILINLHPDRKNIFIIDDEDNRVTIPSKAFVFDPRNWHGTVGGDFYSWSLRIDGKFNDEWLDKVGIKSYYRK